MVSIIKHCLPVLYADKKTLHHILRQGCSFSSKKAPNLGTMLSPSLFRSTSPSISWLGTVRFYPCGYNCGYNTWTQCKRHRKSKSVISFSTSRTYPVKSFINCNSKMIVYLIDCSTCRVQYVGCTICNLRIRISEHYNDTLAMQKIFQMYLNILEQSMVIIWSLFPFAVWNRWEDLLGGDTHHALVQREVWWIHRLLLDFLVEWTVEWMWICF